MISQFTDFEYAISLVKSLLKQKGLSPDQRNRINLLLTKLEKCRTDPAEVTDLLEYLKRNKDFSFGAYIQRNAKVKLQESLEFRLANHVSKIIKKHQYNNSEAFSKIQQKDSYMPLPSKQPNFATSYESVSFLFLFLYEFFRYLFRNKEK